MNSHETNEYINIKHQKKNTNPMCEKWAWYVNGNLNLYACIYIYTKHCFKEFLISYKNMFLDI